MLKIKDVIGKKPPCIQCPYALGQVKMLRDPCPECKLNNYQMYEILQKGKFIGNSGQTSCE